MNVDTACAILDHTEVVYIERFHSNSEASLHLTVGSRLPAYNLATGRAILAFIDPKEAEALIDASGVVAHTPNTITEKTALPKRLDEVREAGFAINEQKLVLGMADIAVPVMKGSEADGSAGLPSRCSV